MEVITMTLGQKLKVLREKRGWTQAQAAERLGISSQVVSNYERDYRSPDKETLSRIAKVYNCSLDWLLDVTNNSDRINDPTSDNKKDITIELTDEERRVLEEMKKYPVFFNDLASDPSKIKKVIKMWEFIKTDLENDDDEEPED
jgi:transcriptional regulator with XRE-family HTH domain